MWFTSDATSKPSFSARTATPWPEHTASTRFFRQKDADLIEAARTVADELLSARKSTEAQKHLDRWLGSRQFYLRA